MPVTGGVGVLREALRRLDEAGLMVDDAGLGRPTLDDVFLTLTGHGADDEPTPPAKPAHGHPEPGASSPTAAKVSR